MKKLIATLALTIFATAANAQKWECRDLSSGTIILTLEQTSNEPIAEKIKMYPATVTDAFGAVHKASVSMGNLEQTWLWGDGTQGGDTGNQHYQVDMKINGKAILTDYSNTGTDTSAKEPDYFMQCMAK